MNLRPRPWPVSSRRFEHVLPQADLLGHTPLLWLQRVAWRGGALISVGGRDEGDRSEFKCRRIHEASQHDSG